MAERDRLEAISMRRLPLPPEDQAWLIEEVHRLRAERENIRRLVMALFDDPTD